MEKETNNKFSPADPFKPIDETPKKKYPRNLHVPLLFCRKENRGLLLFIKRIVWLAQEKRYLHQGFLEKLLLRGLHRIRARTEWILYRER